MAIINDVAMMASYNEALRIVKAANASDDFHAVIRNCANIRQLQIKSIEEVLPIERTTIEDLTNHASSCYDLEQLQEYSQGLQDRIDFLSKLRSDNTFVYFLQIDNAGPIKIGTSSNLRRRILTIRPPWNFNELTVRALIHGYDLTEMYLNGLFKDLRIQGEWFKPSGRLVEFIEFLMANYQFPALKRRNKQIARQER